jgi:hypothetical protein
MNSSNVAISFVGIQGLSVALGICRESSFSFGCSLLPSRFPLGRVALSSVVKCPYIEANRVNADKSKTGGCANDIVPAVDKTI